jgi:hypothetical protein
VIVNCTLGRAGRAFSRGLIKMSGLKERVIYVAYRMMDNLDGDPNVDMPVIAAVRDTVQGVPAPKLKHSWQRRHAECMLGALGNLPYRKSRLAALEIVTNMIELVARPYLQEAKGRRQKAA